MSLIQNLYNLIYLNYIAFLVFFNFNMSMNCLELNAKNRKYLEWLFDYDNTDYIRGGEYRSRTDDLLRARQAL
jgi:hypothetical protein